MVCALGMALLGYSVMLGNLMGDKPNGGEVSDHIRGLVLAISGLWVTNVCVNVVQGPARAIVADLVPQEEQQMGNAMVSNVQGISAVLANVVGAQLFNTDNPYVWLFSIGVVVILLSVIPTLLVAKENKFERPAGTPKPTILSVFAKIFRGFYQMPNAMVRTVLLYFFSWSAFAPFMIYLTQYFAREVYPNDYEYGVKMGMYALAGYAGVSLLYALLLPSVLRLVGVKVAYFLSQLLATACYLLFLFFPQPPTAFLLTALLGINFTTFNSIPFALVTSIVDPKDAGLFMGVLNSASVVSQTLSNTLAGQIVAWKGESVGWGIAFGSLFSFIALILVFFLPTQHSSSSPPKSLNNETDPLLNTSSHRINSDN